MYKSYNDYQKNVQIVWKNFNLIVLIILMKSMMTLITSSVRLGFNISIYLTK